MKAKDLLAIYARYNKDADGAMYGLLDGLSNEEREKGRGSYYGSLSGLARHVLGGTMFFLGAMAEGVPDNAAAQAAAGPVAGLKVAFEGPVTDAQWGDIRAAFAVADDALVSFVSSLSDADLAAPVKWFSGSPPTVPVHFMLSQLVMHNTHHRGQVSQILDELGVEHNWSGIGADRL
ncbi:MAG: DinB family protein [Spirochaetaceae bacterium]|jgi:uncharacterized damage-inducible protein DinB|nr:DinB family protein [Spirochaetaceae bacterium]